MKDAEKFASEDAQKKEKAEVMNQADTIQYSSEKTLIDAGDKLTAEQKESVQKGIDALKEARKTDDLAKIKSETEALTKTMNEVATVMYQQAAQQYQAQQQAQQQGGAKQEPPKDNVYDADYKVDEEKR
jgi:molecular chaperone DnaK